MYNFRESRTQHIYHQLWYIFDPSFEKHINEKDMPDFRKWGLTQYVIQEYVDKILEHDAKWSFGGDGIDGVVFKWCCYVGWLVCGGMGYLMGSGWGAVLGFALMVGVFYLACAIIKFIKGKERVAINSQLVENYLEEYTKWKIQHYPHSR